MQVRRALLAFVVVFAVVTLIAALSAPPETDDSPPAAATATTGPGPTTLSVQLRHPVEGVPPVRQVRGGSHLVVRVEAREAGDVEIAGLGLVQPVSPGTPAVFDVLANRPGRYAVSLRAVGGERIELGTLAVIE
jgi:hypothetical protein